MVWTADSDRECDDTKGHEGSAGKRAIRPEMVWEGQGEQVMETEKDDGKSEIRRELEAEVAEGRV